MSFISADCVMHFLVFPKPLVNLFSSQLLQLSDWGNSLSVLCLDLPHSLVIIVSCCKLCSCRRTAEEQLNCTARPALFVDREPSRFKESEQ